MSNHEVAFSWPKLKHNHQYVPWTWHGRSTRRGRRQGGTTSTFPTVGCSTQGGFPCHRSHMVGMRGAKKSGDAGCSYRPIYTPTLRTTSTCTRGTPMGTRYGPTPTGHTMANKVGRQTLSQPTFRWQKCFSRLMLLSLILCCGVVGTRDAVWASSATRTSSTAWLLRTSNRRPWMRMCRYSG
jgi:hypothetical protein